MPNLLKSYFFWTYPRGSFHYDVMVTAILLFMFVTPRFIDFKDRPVETVALHSSEVRADDMGNAATDAERRAAILRVVEPISGEVSLERYEPVKDSSGHIIAYNAWLLR